MDTFFDDDLTIIEDPEMHDDYRVMYFERAFLITMFLIGFFALWCCAISSQSSQPRTYMYEGDTVATEDDRHETIREERSRTPTNDIISTKNGVVGPPPQQVPTDITLAHPSHDHPGDTRIPRKVDKRVESIAFVMASVSEIEEGPDVEQ